MLFRLQSLHSLWILFLLTLPLVNPWVRGDLVGYYAYLRSLLVEHMLDFADDWRHGNLSFTMGRVYSDGIIEPLQYTVTGHLDNHFAVGPPILQTLLWRWSTWRAGRYHGGTRSATNSYRCRNELQPHSKFIFTAAAR